MQYEKNKKTKQNKIKRKRYIELPKKGKQNRSFKQFEKILSERKGIGQ